MVPMPPASEVPPMTAAAITRSSSSVPSALVEALRRAEEMAALMATSAPMIMNTFIVTQRVLMPARLAASGLPPMAKT